MINTSALSWAIPTTVLQDVSRQLGRDIPEIFHLHLRNWVKLSRGTGAPFLSDLFVESDPKTQPKLVVIDIEHEEVQKIRLVGTGIADFFGFDATGYDFLQSVAPDIKGIFVDAHRRMSSELVGKFHLAVCSTSTGRELEVLAFALPYLRRDGLPCAAWLLQPGSGLKIGETGSQVRAVLAQFWIELPKSNLSNLSRR